MADETKTDDAMIRSLEGYRKTREDLGKRFNVIDLPGSPMALAPLHAIGWEIVTVTPGTGKWDTSSDYYEPSGTGRKAPTKFLSNRIAKAAGVVWQRLQRVDDRRRPHARRYQAEGAVTFTDGTLFLLCDDKEVDLSGDRRNPDTWSARVAQIVVLAERHNARLKEGEQRRDPWIQILQERATIDERALTGAKNRSIRNGLGVADTYGREELLRGFVVFRVYATYEDEDPYIQRQAKLAILAARTGASRLLYGARRSDAALPPAESDTRALPPSPECADDEEPDFDPETGEVHDEEHDEPPPVDQPPPDARPAAPVQPPAAPPPAPPPSAPPAPARPALDPQLICGKRKEDGSLPRRPASSFTPAQLDEKASYAESQRPNWSPKWAAKNQAELDAIRAWAAYLRAGGSAGEPSHDDKF